jgi:Fe-S-cluster containining protein
MPRQPESTKSLPFIISPQDRHGQAESRPVVPVPGPRTNKTGTIVPIRRQDTHHATEALQFYTVPPKPGGAARGEPATRLRVSPAACRRGQPELPIICFRTRRGAVMPTVRVKRSDLKPGEVLCSHCTALCCRYFTLQIQTPETWDDYDNLRWYLAHGRSALFVEDGNWFLLVFGDCKYLLSDNRCGIYDDRPAICRVYSTESCEYDNDFVFEKYFESPEQVWEYAEAILPPREVPPEEQRRRKRSLPILSGTP